MMTASNRNGWRVMRTSRRWLRGLCAVCLAGIAWLTSAVVSADKPPAPIPQPFDRNEPYPKYDPATGDVERNPDGSVKLYPPPGPPDQVPQRPSYGFSPGT